MEGSLRILDTNYGASNIVEQEVISEVMDGVLKDISTLLKGHCGPYGRFAMITPEEHEGMSPPLFTKDGINIVKATTYANPIETQTKDMMVRIGAKVEQAAGDGTTSSMIIAAESILQLRKYINANKEIHYRMFTDKYTEFVSLLNVELDELSITPHEHDVELIKGIAYHQAMTSSHGNIELSKMVAELMSSIPKDGWKHLIFKSESRETKQLYRIEIDEASYSGDAYIFNNQMLNDTTGTGFEVEDAELHIMPGGLVSNSLDYHELVETIKNRTIEDKHLVVVCLHNSDQSVTTELLDLFQVKRKEGVAFTIFRFPLEHAFINGISGLFALTGYHHSDNQEKVLKFNDIGVKYKMGRLSLYGVIEYVDGKHPDIHDDKSPVNCLINALEDFLLDNQDNKSMVDYTNTPKLAKEMLNTLKMDKQGYIVIGGTGYDNRAARDVVTDVLSSVRESLTNGVTLGGFKTLALALSNIYDSSDDKYITSITDIFLSNIIELLRFMYIDLCPFTKVTNSNNTVFDLVSKFDYSFDVLTGISHKFDDYTLRETSGESPIIVQPKTTELEFIKRFGEVATKFLFATRVIIPGGVLLNNKAPEPQ